jgi:peptidoglycan hydrolase-like protein with peptidoglycan-binding domain
VNAEHTRYVVPGLVLALFLSCLAPGARASDGRPADSVVSGPQASLQLVVSLADQRIGLYRGTELIESAPVSTGKPGHATPAGIYSILQKRKWHRSNIYSAAPMPFMQRMTWSGIALHAGPLPGYPASHGCIRLDKEFARRLFQTTRIGADVIVAAGSPRPAAIEHEWLLQLMPPGGSSMPRLVELAEAGSGTAVALRLAVLDPPAAPAAAEPSSRKASPLRILITRRTGRELIMDVQSLLAGLGHDPGEIDGYLGRDTAAAIRSFQAAAAMPPTGSASDELIDALYRAAGRDKVDGHLYVRQDHNELFDVPVLIDRPGAPLGTHVFTAMPFSDDRPGARWTVVTLNDEADSGAAAALSRLTVSAAARRRIAALLTPGSTLIVSDHGLGRETGKGTDFIVQLR